MNRWVKLGVLLCGGLAAACAGKNKEVASEGTTPAGEQAAMVPSANVGEEAGGGAAIDTNQAQPVSGKTGDELMEPDLSEHKQNVAGGSEASGGMRLQQKGEFCKTTGQIRTQEGRYFQPEGTYGKTGTFGTEGKTGVRGTYGTYVKPEGSFKTTDRLFVNPEGNYIMPKGSSQPIVKAQGEPLTIETERQPVAGHENVQPGLFITDDKGRSWAVQNKEIVKNVEQKLQSEGYNPGNVDGVADAQLGSAIIKFQTTHKLKVTGSLNRETAQAMGLTWDQLLQRQQPGQPGQQPSPSEMPPSQQ